MNSEPDLRADHALELLTTLRETVSRYAAKEAALTRAIGARRLAAGRKERETSERTGEDLARETAGAETVFQDEERRVRAIHEERRARIQRAYDAGIRNLPRRAREVKEGWLGELQMRRFHAQQKQAADLEAAELAFARSDASLAQHREAILRLKGRARDFFRGYWKFQRLLAKKQEPSGALQDFESQEQLMSGLRARVAAARSRIGAFRKLPVPLFFAYMPLPVLIVLIALGSAAPWFLGAGTVNAEIAAGVGFVLLATAVGVHRLGFRQSEPVALSIFSALGEAGKFYNICRDAAETARKEDRLRVEREYEQKSASIDAQWEKAGEVESAFEKAARERLDAQLPRAISRNERLLRPRLRRIESERASAVERGQAAAENERGRASLAREYEMTALDAEENAEWEALEAGWRGEVPPLYREIGILNSAARSDWDETPPAEFPAAAKFGRLRMKLESLPKDPRLALPGPSEPAVPLALAFPGQGSLLFETPGAGGAVVFSVLNNVILRLLASTPPGKISFTIIDPVGLGENFAGFMHLSDYEESLINRRIWTQRDQIEERLGELSEHIEKVIQMYLRNEYATITEYNRQAGSVAEKYHFLVVADFPANFSEIAAKRLQSIAVSGPRCGIYTLIHWDARQQSPDGFSPDELRKNSVRIVREGDAFILGEGQAALDFDPPADPEMAARLIHAVGKRSIDSNRVEVPFSQIAPKPGEFWTNDTTNELRIAIGRTGATKHQYLAIGKGTRQHALFAGKTGSGKSTLFHVIITNLALACSPEQVEFYLIDFKKGVEFKCYSAKRLPHARVIAIESDREFGLSVLQRVDEELRRRGDMFRKLGVQDLAGYKRAGGAEPMPRSLLLIDEFQEFFIEDDSVSQSASMLFDRIIRQGRAFGIHVLLGSQTLGGAYSLARATLGQMVIRVALQCNEADAYLIMDDNNPAPRLLSRPGEGIYNDAAGAVEGNSPFQVVWLPDDERDAWLDKVRDLAKGRHDAQPVVFEGNSPADIRENGPLRAALEARPVVPPAAARVWLGAPNSIKGPTEAVFQRQSGSNLLIIGQREENALTLLGVSLLALAAQYPRGGARFIFLHSAAPGSPDAAFIDRLALPGVTLARAQDIPEVMNTLSGELKARTGGEAAVYLFIHGIHKFRKLRHEDDFSFSSSDSGPDPGAQFGEILMEGSAQGIHVLASIDALSSINRYMTRKVLGEFGMRVLFQMGANDSAALIDTPKAGNLGLHRALFYNEHEGLLETFRPYALPPPEWVREAVQKI